MQAAQNNKVYKSGFRSRDFNILIESINLEQANGLCLLSLSWTSAQCKASTLYITTLFHRGRSEKINPASTAQWLCWATTRTMAQEA